VVSVIDTPGDRRLAEYAHVGDARWLASHGLFVAEGRYVVERLIAAGRFVVQSILVTPAAHAALAGTLAASGADVLLCSETTLRQATGYDFHRGCLALAQRPIPLPAGQWLTGDHVLLALEGVGNPDNVGGLFRTAAAFDVSGILVSPTTADPLYRKSIRTSMGAVLTLPWSSPDPWLDTLDMFRTEGYDLAALTPRADAKPVDQLPSLATGRTIVIVGSEGPGLSTSTLSLADHLIRVPISRAVDSLNVVTAAAIALHRLHTGRDAGSGTREHPGTEPGTGIRDEAGCGIRGTVNHEP
jgi:tRNA G18 (ribose-2'-O)-methylase SpoU